jgi:hypothetical protein
VLPPPRPPLTAARRANAPQTNCASRARGRVAQGGTLPHPVARQATRSRVSGPEGCWIILMSGFGTIKRCPLVWQIGVGWLRFHGCPSTCTGPCSPTLRPIALLLTLLQALLFQQRLRPMLRTQRCQQLLHALCAVFSTSVLARERKQRATCT